MINRWVNLMSRGFQARGLHVANRPYTWLTTADNREQGSMRVIGSHKNQKTTFFPWFSTSETFRNPLLYPG